MATKSGVADDFVLRQIDLQGLAVVSHWRQMIPSGMARPLVEPVRPDLQDLVGRSPFRFNIYNSTRATQCITTSSV